MANTDSKAESRRSGQLVRSVVLAGTQLFILVLVGLGAWLGSQFPELAASGLTSTAVGALAGLGIGGAALFCALAYVWHVQRAIRRGERLVPEAGRVRNWAERMADEDDASAESPRQRQRRLRTVTVSLAGVALLAGAAMVYSYSKEADLRGEDLQGATATVQDLDHRRRAPEVLEVQYVADGETVQAEIPVDEDAEQASGRVEVLYVPADPTRARTRQGWAPFYQGSGPLYLAVCGGGAVVALLLSLRSSRRARAE